MDIISQIEKENIEALGKDLPTFNVGDTLQVHVKVTEGTRERVQVFEGVCIARKNSGINSNFTVRKLSYGEGVERIFPLYSPTIEKIEVARRGDVRRAKLYYLRDRRGKAARITEKVDWNQKNASSAGKKEEAAVVDEKKITPEQIPPQAESQAVEKTA